MVTIIKPVVEWWREPVLGKKQVYYSLLFTALFFLSAHAYGCLNPTITHDALSEINLFGIADHANLPSYVVKIRAGRFVQVIYQALIRGKLALPWLSGLLSCCWICCFSVIMVKLFKVTSKLQVLFIAGILATNLTVTGTLATYIHDADSNFLGLAMAGMTVYLWRAATAGYRKGIPFVVLCLGCYQSYFCVMIALVIIISLMDLIDGIYADVVVKSGIRAIFMLFFGGLIYLLFVFLSIKLFDTDVGGVFGESIQIRMSIPKRLVATYQGFIMPVIRTKSLHTTGFQTFFNLVFFAVGGGCFFSLLMRNTVKMQAKLLGMTLIMIFPLGANLTCFFSPGGVTILSGYAWWFSYLLVVLLFFRAASEERWKQIKKPVLKSFPTALIIFMLLQNLQTANAAYLLREFRSSSLLSVMTRVKVKMDSISEYEPGVTPVCFIDVPSFDVPTGFERIAEISGMRLGLSTSERYRNYFSYYLGENINLVDKAKHDQIEEQLDGMTIRPFPDDDALFFMDDVLIVYMD